MNLDLLGFGSIARGEEARTAGSATQTESNGLDTGIRQLIDERLAVLVDDIVRTTKAPITAVLLEIVSSATFQGLVAARTIGRAEGLESPRLLVGRDYVTIKVKPERDDPEPSDLE